MSSSRKRRSGDPLSADEWPSEGRQLARRGPSLRDQPRPSADVLSFRGNRFTRWFGWTMMRLHGWDMCGTWPSDKKVIAFAGPHTCNYDGYLAIYAMMALNVQFSFFIKKDVFAWPFNYLWNWMGGIPVDRSRAHGLVEAVQKKGESSDQFIFAVTPEGTRQPPKRLKSGVFRLAKELELPLLPVTWDFDTRTIWFEEPLDRVDTFEEWERQLYRYYDGIRGGEGYFMGVESPNGRRLPDEGCPRPFTPGKMPVSKR